VVTRIENAIQYKDIALGAFLDIEGTFDKNSFETIIQAAGKHGIEPAICRWICAMLENRNIIATLSGETHKVSVARGCPQGGVLSLLMWSLVVDDFIWCLKSDGYYTVGYADDIAILINGKFSHTVSEILQTALYIFQQWCKKKNFILGLDILRAYNSSVDIGRQTLRLAEEELFWSPGAGPRPSSSEVCKDQVIPSQCEGIVMARLQSHLGVEKELVEPSPQAPPPDAIYIDRTLAQPRQEGPERVLNATHRDQKLTRTPLAQTRPVTIVTPPDLVRQQDQESSSKL
jgi:hypothetical protein